MVVEHVESSCPTEGVAPKRAGASRHKPLAGSGFVVLAINFRSDTTNEKGMPISVGSDEDNAAYILAAAAYLRARGAKSISSGEPRRRGEQG
jgi:hypothetical protein